MAYNEITTAIGLRQVYVGLRADGGGLSGTGLLVSGAVALTVTIPDPNRVPARGDDRTYYTFNLPPTEAPSGELRVSKTQFDVIALVTGSKIWGSSPLRKIGVSTDLAGLEPAVILWGSRQAVDTDPNSATFGAQLWVTYIFLNALLSPKPAPAEDQNIGEVVYAVTANDSTTDELGNLFTTGVNGFTKAAYIIVVSDALPNNALSFAA